MNVKSLILFGFCALMLSSCHKKSTYKDEDLLFRYIDEHQNEISEDDSYVFISYRKHVVCASCLQTFPLEKIIDSAQCLYPLTPIYVVTDDSTGTSMLFSKFKQIKKIFKEETITLQQYGFYTNYPKIFEIEGNSIQSWVNVGAP